MATMPTFLSMTRNTLTGNSDNHNKVGWRRIFKENVSVKKSSEIQGVQKYNGTPNTPTAQMPGLEVFDNQDA